MPTNTITPRSRWHSLVFLCGVALYLLPFMRLIQQFTDEGIFLSGAARIMRGQVFARDFFEMMGPGSFYYLVFFFKLFGVTILATRISLFLTFFGTAAAIYFLSCRIVPRYRFLPCLIIFATYFADYSPGISHHFDSNLLALLSVVCVVLWNEKRRPSLLFFVGILVGLATCTLLHKGILLFCAILLWLCLQKLPKPAFRLAISLLAAGYFCVIVLMLGYFWSQHALTSLIQANLIWPFSHYESVNIVPYAHGIGQIWMTWSNAGSTLGWAAYIGSSLLGSVLIVPALFIAALPVILSCFAYRLRSTPVHPEILLLWLCGAALFLSEMHRKDIVHLAYGTPLLVILCIYLLAEANSKLTKFTLQSVAITSVTLALVNLTFAFLVTINSTRVGKIGMYDRDHFGHDEILTMLDDHVTPGDDLFIYPYCPSYYFLSNTINPTPYSVLYNGNELVQFQQVISILDQRKVRHVLWDTTFETKVIPRNFPGAPRNTPGMLLFEHYLNEHYKVVAEVNGFRMMERNNDAAGR